MGTSEKELLHSYPGHSLLQSISSGLDEDDDAYNRIEQSPAPLSNKPNRQTDRQIQVRGQVSKFPHEPTETSSTTTRGHTQAVADQCPVRTTMGCSQLRGSSPYELSLAHLASSSSEIPGQDCLGHGLVLARPPPPAPDSHLQVLSRIRPRTFLTTY